MSNEYVHKKEALSLENLIKKMKSNTEFRRAGALAIFVGVVRGETHKGEKVQKMEIEAYEEKANEVLLTICQDLKRREGIVDVQIHHFIGEFTTSEDLVYVLVAGYHRENVFSVLKEAVERYKKEAPIFKKEYLETKEGKVKAHWVAEAEKA
ncbi:MAG: molybdenum cofactor biosynthesis protein MoaE [Candidatus Bathyarchaeia archaeon]